MLRVTQAIGLVGLKDSFYCTEEGLEVGTAVHKAIEYDLLGRLNEAKLDPRVAPRVHSFRIWLREMQPKILASEQEIENEAMGYRGRLDLRALVLNRHFVVDLKCGGEEDWHRYQTALYAMGWAAETGEPTPFRAGLYLDPQGRRPKFVEFSDRQDFERAKAIITVAHIRSKNGAAA